MNTEKDEYIVVDFWKILDFLLVNAVKIVLSMAVCAVLAYICASVLLKPTYSARTDILVNNTQESTEATITTSDLNASATLAKTYAVLVKSHSLLGQVIDNLGLDCTYSYLESSVSVESVNNTQVMRITVQYSDPEIAVQIAEEIIKLVPDIFSKTLDMGSIKVVDEPWTTGNKVSSGKRSYVIEGAAIGFLCSVCILFLKETLMKRFGSRRRRRRSGTRQTGQRERTRAEM